MVYLNEANNTFSNTTSRAISYRAQFHIAQTQSAEKRYLQTKKINKTVFSKILSTYANISSVILR